MNAATLVLRTLVRVLFPVQLVLGLLFWSGHLEALVPVHMLIGLGLVAALWGLAVTAALAGAGPGIVAFGLAWGLVVPVLGLTQARLLPVTPTGWSSWST